MVPAPMSFLSSYLPELSPLPLPWMGLLWLVYGLAVGPLLYYGLLRGDRRDWAWGCVPAAALLAALLFYFLAPVSRIPGYLSQTLARVHLFSPELAEVTGESAVVNRAGGEVVVALERGLLPWVREDAQIKEGEGHMEVSYPQMPPNSLSLFTWWGVMRPKGDLQAELYLEGDSLRGEIWNRTPFHLEDCHLLLGNLVLPLGSLPSGGGRFP